MIDQLAIFLLDSPGKRVEREVQKQKTDKYVSEARSEPRQLLVQLGGGAPLEVTAASCSFLGRSWRLNGHEMKAMEANLPVGRTSYCGILGGARFPSLPCFVMFFLLSFCLGDGVVKRRQSGKRPGLGRRLKMAGLLVLI